MQNAARDGGGATVSWGPWMRGNETQLRLSLQTEHLNVSDGDALRLGETLDLVFWNRLSVYIFEHFGVWKFTTCVFSAFAAFLLPPRLAAAPSSLSSLFRFRWRPWLLGGLGGNAGIIKAFSAFARVSPWSPNAGCGNARLFVSSLVSLKTVKSNFVGGEAFVNTGFVLR